MEEFIAKAATLIESLPYIQQYYGRIVVVKIGGAVLDRQDAQTELLRDIAFMNYVGMQPVIVHGGSTAINDAMAQAGLEPQFVQGLRYTDERTLAIVESVLCGRINPRIVETLRSLGVEAIGLHSLSSCVLFAERTYLHGENGRRIDIGSVGRINQVNDRILRLLCAADTIPVIAPISRDPAGGKLNVNADHAAGEVAAAAGAEKLVVLSDTHGIRTRRDDPNSFCSSLGQAQVADLMRQGVIDRGMIPKVEACLRALEAGVKKAHIIDGRMNHSLLLEIFTPRGVGTEILQDEEDK